MTTKMRAFPTAAVAARRVGGGVCTPVRIPRLAADTAGTMTAAVWQGAHPNGGGTPSTTTRPDSLGATT